MVKKSSFRKHSQRNFGAASWGKAEGGERKGGGGVWEKINTQTPSGIAPRQRVCGVALCCPVVSPKISHTKWTKQDGRASLPTYGGS
jgi:hypothetical protein